MTNAASRAARSVRQTALMAVVLLLSGCANFLLEDCGGKVVGVNEPRIRSSHFRMLLANLPAASNRFAPYAAMSALAYAEDANCGTHTPKLSKAERVELENALTARGWLEVKDVAWTPACEDDTGLYLRVWKLGADPSAVVMAFRGTWGANDWLFGNMHWMTRWLPMEDQYSRSRDAAQRVFDHFPDVNGRKTRFYTTGHSLGGGLAQHVLYSYPKKVDQVFAFDPSSVTGFQDQSAENQVAGCDCGSDTLKGEPRIFRVYDAYEILANMRILHKLFLPPERHIHEVRFPNAASHSMKGLASYLLLNAPATSGYSAPWFAGKGQYAQGESCTNAFIRKQRDSCEAKVTKDQWNKCPQ